MKALDFQLFELGDIGAARQIAATLPLNESSLIALGDIERMAGNIDLAGQYYTKAQNLLQRPAAAQAGPQPFTGFADATPTPPPQEGAIVITTATTQDADWRRRAVLENSCYAEVKNLLNQNALDDARAKLDAWALEFPLAKLAGDYTLADAEYAMKFNDFARGQRLLKSYRTHVDLSPQLAEAMQLEWECDSHLNLPAETKSLAADILKRFPDLPLAKQVQAAP